MTAFDQTVAKNLGVLERLMMRRVDTRNEARALIARETKLQPGTLENIRRARTKGIRAYIADAIHNAVLRELSSEIKRLEHERFVIAQTGRPVAIDHLSEIAEDIAAVRRALTAAK